ncbi:MAG TPA: penicillin-binding protein 2 [Actinomycetota bacterium]|nr:penicillin-binding protein 2 [Actinomycetota bacterium]
MTRPPAGRLAALFVAFALSFAGVGARLVVLQVRDAEAYEALARDQRLRSISLPAGRGTIYDRDRHELALSLPARAVYADPRLVKHPARVAAALAPHLEVPARRLERMLAADGSFVYLARRVDLPIARRIERLALPGIGLLEETKRYYPGSDLAAQVLGFVGVDGVGLTGLEMAYEDLLAGDPGRMVIEQDPGGTPIPQAGERLVRPVPGEDLVLTLDRDLQFHAQRALQEAVRSNGARGGMVIALRPGTGEVLAMATAPAFDLNAYSEAPEHLLRNRPVTDVYEPGSVNKVITAAAALEERAIGLEETLTVPDTYRVGDGVFHDAHQHPTVPMTLTDIIADSSNVGTIMVAERLGKETLDRYLRRFGFGRPTGIGFPGEADGILLTPERWWQTSMGTIPIGQGVAVTPLQMTSVYATIASGGVRVEPTLVRGTVDGRGRFRPAPAPDEERVVSRRTARKVTGMLAQAVAEGTGQAARLPGYWVAGKTGTARKPLEGALGYSDQYVASFIGFLPARDPAIVIAAILDEPDTVYGGIAAAPLFRDVARFAAAHLRIPVTRGPVIPPLARETEG